MDYYAILGVHPTAEDIVIRAAYKALAQRYHPDRFNGSQDEAHRRMSELTKAYDVLADPVRRKKYDRRRQAYTQSVATYFNGASKDTRLAIDPRDRSSPAAMRRRSRIALSALMVAVVALSAFNLYQYSAQIRDWLNPGAPAQTVIEARPRATPEVPAPVAVGNPASVAVGGAALGASQPAVASVGNLPTNPPDVAGASPATAGAPAPSPRQLAVDAAPVVITPAVSTTAVSTAAVSTPTVSTPPGSTAAVSTTRASPAAFSAPITVAPVARPVADAPVTAEPKRTAIRSTARSSAAASRPPSAPAPAEGSAQCNDTVAALGLCSPPTTARNK